MMRTLWQMLTPFIDRHIDRYTLWQMQATIIAYDDDNQQMQAIIIAYDDDSQQLQAIIIAYYDDSQQLPEWQVVSCRHCP
jgi:hypothetical protein